MKALVLGCGEMAETAISDLNEYGDFAEINIATRDTAKAVSLLDTIKAKKSNFNLYEIDVSDSTALIKLMEPNDIIINCIGPNYKYEKMIAIAAIKSKVNLIDLNDDFETTFEMLELDESAKDAGVAILIGMGASPGVNNILVRAATNQLDEVDEIHTAWVMSGSDPGGLALSYHLLNSLSGRALTFQDGKWIEVQSFVDGKELIEFPEPVGKIYVYHIGHPEPITLARYYKNAKYIDDKASFNPPWVNDMIVALGKMAREMKEDVRVNGYKVNTMDFVASYFHKKCKSLVDVPKNGGLRVEVHGKKSGKQKKIFFSSAGRIANGTGIPAAIGAKMFVENKISGKGILIPEECINPHDFIYEIITRRNVAKLNGWVED